MKKLLLTTVFCLMATPAIANPLDDFRANGQLTH